MSELYWLTGKQMARLHPYLYKSHGNPRVDDRQVLSRIIFVNRNDLHWQDTPYLKADHTASSLAVKKGASVG